MSKMSDKLAHLENGVKNSSFCLVSGHLSSGVAENGERLAQPTLANAVRIGRGGGQGQTGEWMHLLRSFELQKQLVIQTY